MAVRYALGRWEALMRYCDDGHLEIDNNAAERIVAHLLTKVTSAKRGCSSALELRLPGLPQLS